MAIWRDLVDDHGFLAQYASVRSFVVTLRGPRAPEAHPVIVTAPGEEGQVDYGDGPMVRHPATGKYRRTRLFLLTLGYSRKSVRLLTWQSSTRIVNSHCQCATDSRAFSLKMRHQLHEDPWRFSATSSAAG